MSDFILDLYKQKWQNMKIIVSWTILKFLDLFLFQMNYENNPMKTNQTKSKCGNKVNYKTDYKTGTGKAKSLPLRNLNIQSGT